jgi:hypothetical protein
MFAVTAYSPDNGNAECSAKADCCGLAVGCGAAPVCVVGTVPDVVVAAGAGADWP